MTIAHVLAGLDEALSELGALLAARLEDDTVFLRRCCNDLGLVQGESQGLLAVDVEL